MAVMCPDRRALSLLQITGPITVDGLDAPLSADNAVQYLLKDQYLNADNANRIDMLEQVVKTTVTELFESTLPSPPNLAKMLAPLAAQGRQMGWASRAEEEQIFTQAKMSGALPDVGGGDGFTFALTNAAGNKIDVFNKGSATYVVRTNPATGKVHATGKLILRNTAPSSGCPTM